MSPVAPSAIYRWSHRCDTNDVTVGIASHTAFPDLDYMLCIQVPGMLMTPTNGYAAKYNARSCNTLGVINSTVIDSLWGNEQYYNPATSLAYPCRIIMSNQKVDLTRCLNATETYRYVSDVRRPLKMLLCPPHMVAQALYATATVRAFVTCCLIY
ncbi:uncharacterized protein LOC135196070 [Macrobrachium nipponense]|uniref:uncharacterized protein LOC135196070 n=1 Tax=Macrobrachium nipponense TaxID=159736 RepID=UPI0030C84C85